MNEVKIFEHPKFGKIRTLMEPDGSPMFCALDAATALGHKDQTKAIKTHCRWVAKRRVPHPQNVEKEIETNFITEGDLYRLAAKSELPGADEFESWIFDEVLPSLRRNGTYSLPGAQQTVGFPHKASSLGEAATLIKTLDKIMTREKQPPGGYCQNGGRHLSILRYPPSN